MNSIIDNIRDISINNVDNGKGIANYIAPSPKEDKSVREVSNGYVIGSIAPIGANPVYGKPEPENNIVNEIEQAVGTTAEQRRNQMAILANTSSPEDLKRMEEEGINPADSDVTTVVTVTDQINANIAKTGGKVYGDLSKEELEEILGSGYLATQVYDAMEGLEPQEQLYLVKNEMEPSVQNIYKAQHSAGLPTPTHSVDIKEFQAQVESVIKEADFAVNDMTLEAAKTLLENEIPLTPENLSYYIDLQELTNGVKDRSILDNQIEIAFSEGKGPEEAMLLSGYSATERANEIGKVIENTEDDDIAYCLENDLEITAFNLKKAQNHRGEVSSDKWEKELSFISAKRVLEETRLSMTTEANLSLLKKGISIDTKPLEAVVEDLKNQEKSFYESLFADSKVEPTNENIATYTDTIELLSQLKSAPATILSADDVEETLKTYGYKAEVQRASYAKAGEEYEKLWTAPRKDMGDSIQKAFRNVDDILADLKLDTTDSNRRAVRILAYNQNEINVENIDAIKAKDEQMQRLFATLTPKTTLELIRRGENPMDIPVDKLSDMAEEIKTEIGDDGTERFEKFLYRLERNKDISEEERSSYIGIYRLIAQVEKNDGAALGAAYNQGSEITMRSLLTQIRNSKKHNDYTIDDTFDGVSQKENGTKIDAQIESAFQIQTKYHNNCVKNIIQNLTPEMLHPFFDADHGLDAMLDMTPEQMKDALYAKGENAYSDTMDTIDEEYANQTISEMKQAAVAPDRVYELLDRLDMPTSVNNVLAAEQLMAHPGNAISTIWKDKNLLKDAKEILIERFGEAVQSPVELADAMETLEKVAVHCMDSMVAEGQALHNSNITSVDIKAMQLATKQITIATKQSEEESFLIPMETADGVTGVSLKVVRGSGKKGLVDIFLETKSVGRISASFEAKTDRISGTIMCDDRESREFISQKIPALAAEVAGEEGESVDLSVVYGEEVNPRQQKSSDQTIIPNSEEYNVQTGRLYRIAKSFIEFASEFI